MSATTAKAERRKLRRAVGETTAAALVEQSNVIAKHDMAIATMSRQIDVLLRVVDDLRGHPLQQDRQRPQIEIVRG